jgi:hypothetical protein
MNKQSRASLLLRRALVPAIFLLLCLGGFGYFSGPAGHFSLLPEANAQMGTSSQISGMRNILDFADEAQAKGYRITNIPRQQFVTMQINAAGAQVVRLPVPLFGETKEGVVHVSAYMPTNTPRGRSTVYLWKNGQTIPISRDAAANNEVMGQLVLGSGDNYLAVAVKVDNQWWGRSRVVKVNSPGGEVPKVEPQPAPPSDFWDEANSKGYNPPAKQPVKGFISFASSSRGNIITNIPSPLSGRTSEGFADLNIALPPDTPRGADVFVWNNGNGSLVRRNATPSARILTQTVLSRGDNYICVAVNKGGRYWGRSPMVKVNSTVNASVARFELSWDGPGDVDLHLDNPQGLHVFYANRMIDQQGYRFNLDIDNMQGWGPENIRLYSLPSKQSFRCFVNYYSGGSQLNVTVRMFDKQNKLVKTETKVFTSGMSRPSAQFNEQSWVVGDFEIAP